MTHNYIVIIKKSEIFRITILTPKKYLFKKADQNR